MKDVHQYLVVTLKDGDPETGGLAAQNPAIVEAVHSVLSSMGVEVCHVRCEGREPGPLPLGTSPTEMLADAEALRALGRHDIADRLEQLSWQHAIASKERDDANAAAVDGHPPHPAPGVEQPGCVPGRLAVEHVQTLIVAHNKHRDAHGIQKTLGDAATKAQTLLRFGAGHQANRVNAALAVLDAAHDIARRGRNPKKAQGGVS
jgi:hypothetical protein